MSDNHQLELRVNNLEREVRRLFELVAPPLRKKPAAAYVEPQTRVTAPAVVVPDGMPNADELRRLREAVFQRYPELRPKPDPRDPFDAKDQHDREIGFEAEFLFVAGLPRTKDLNKAFSRSWWTDRVETFRTERGLAGAVDAHGVLVACICQGVAFSLDGWPHSLDVALDPRGYGHELDPQVWRAVLANGVTNQPKPLPRGREWTQSVTHASY